MSRSIDIITGLEREFRMDLDANFEVADILCDGDTCRHPECECWDRLRKAVESQLEKQELAAVESYFAGERVVTADNVVELADIMHGERAETPLLCDDCRQVCDGTTPYCPRCGGQPRRAEHLSSYALSGRLPTLSEIALILLFGLSVLAFGIYTSHQADASLQKHYAAMVRRVK